jgi:hypothetical protein
MLWMVDWLRDKLTNVLMRLRRRKSGPVNTDNYRAIEPIDAGSKAPSVPPPFPQQDRPSDKLTHLPPLKPRAPASPPPPAPPPETVKVSPNRATRRILERRRRRHDKFVKPKGELPPRLPAPPRPAPVRKAKPVEVVDESVVEDAAYWLHGKHHEDAQEVLYNETEMYGEFNFRDTILQQLERYFVYLRRMRGTDNASYHLYRQYGATILPYCSTGSHDRQWRKWSGDELKTNSPLPDWFNRTRPAFGCFVYGADPETEKYEQRKVEGRSLLVPKFMYFTKYAKAPPKVERISGGDTYAMTVWWDKPYDTRKHARKNGVPQSYAIWISKDGKEIEPLRMLVEDDWYVKRRLKRGGHEYHSIPRKQWKIPDMFSGWAEDNGDTVKHFLREVFLDAVKSISLTQLNMVRVMATKGDMAATFWVNVHRMSYFFQDRDITATAHGQRKRIFHMVRPHVRADGTEIKTHFRGQREFTWADYQILITVPGRDHMILDDFNVASHDLDDVKDTSGWIDNKELGRRMANTIKHAPGGL